MSRTLTIAVVGDPEHAFDNLAMPEGELERPYADRRKVELEAEDNERLIDVLARAADEVGAADTPWGGSPSQGISFCAFYRDEDHDGFRVEDVFGRLRTEVTLVDERGRALFGVYFKAENVTVGELVRASEHQALDGDPLRPYLILYPAQGNGMLIPWVVLGGGLKLLWDFMKTVSTVEDTLSFGKRVIDAARDRLRGGKEVVDDHYLEWGERGARPSNFMDFLGLRPWHTADLAPLLGCSEPEAEAVLWAFGYTKDDVGLWRPGGDEEAELLQKAVGDLPNSFNLDMNAFDNLVRERVGELLRSGDLPPRPRYDDDLPDEDEDEDEALVPLIELECECGREDCTVVAALARAYPLGDDDEMKARLLLQFSEGTDHFVLNFVVLGTVLGHLAE